jgi:PAS domain S-box-containing protein
MRSVAAVLRAVADIVRPDRWTIRGYGIAVSIALGIGGAGLMSSVAAVEWMISIHGAKAIPTATVLAALAVPGVVIALLLAAVPLTAAFALRLDVDPIVNLAACARRIESGDRMEIPYVERADLRGGLARALREWQEAAALREVLLRSAPIGILRVEGRVVKDANPAALALLRCRKDELENLDALQLAHPDDRSRLARLLSNASARTNSDRVTVDMRLRRGDGTWLWCSVLVAPVRAEDEAWNDSVVILEDISERKRQAQLAAAVQREMLPVTLPELEGYELAGAFLPAQDVGGDFYDWVDHGEGHLDLTVADVMGKGIGAALLMAALRTALRAAPAELGPAARLASVADAVTFGPGGGDLFVTAFHARLDAASGRMRYVDAGHGYCLVRRATGQIERLSTRSMPLGIASGEEFLEGEVELRPGDVLLACSDGLMETSEGTVRLDVAAAGLANSESARDVVRRLTHGLEGRIVDDAALVVLKRTDPAAPPPPPVPAPVPVAPPPVAEPPPYEGLPPAMPRAESSPKGTEDTMWTAAIKYTFAPYSGPPTLGLLVTTGLVAYLEWRLGSGVAGRIVRAPVGLAVAAPIAAALPWLVPMLLLGIASARKGHLALPALARCARRIAAGERTTVPYTARSDEAGDLARALRDWQEAAAVREALVRSAPVGIFRVGPGGIVLDSNPAASATLGYDRDEFVGSDLRALVHADDTHRIGEVSGLLAGVASDSATVEVRLRRRGGEWLWCSAVVAHISLPGGTRDSIVILEDISERVRQMQWAADVQREMLPNHAPALEGYELAGRLTPAQEVAGDLYDWVEREGRYLDVTVADVMGKGPAAALRVAALRAALRTAPAELGPADRVAHAARTMTFGADGETTFVTLFLARLDIATGKITYVDAGHGYCVVRPARGSAARLTVRSLPLGIGEAFTEGHADLGPGDALVVCSDGLMEIGEDTASLEEVLAGMEAGGRAGALVDRLMARVREQLNDDATAVVLRRQGANPA